MSLKGNLGSVDLANIFQMLSINQKEGTLVITDGLSRKSIYFAREGVSMLSRGKVRQDSLGRILLRYDRITPDQLQRALEKQRSSNRLLGEILVEIGVVSEEDIENALRVQIEEEIYNLFIWKNAEFEFVEGAPATGVDGPERPLTTLTFNVNSLIMEAARRIDEWEYIRSRILSIRDIFRFTGQRADLSDDVFKSPFADKIMQCVDGRSDVNEIVEASYVNKFEVCKLLALLLDQGALEPVPVEDLRVLAAQAAAAGDDVETVKFLQRILDEGALDADLHIALARAFENLGEIEKAACHHKLYAECRLEVGEVADAVAAYTRIRKILPTDLLSRERRLQILTEHALPGTFRPDDVIAEARELAGILTEVGQPRQAVAVLAKGVSLAPDDLEARGQLAVLDMQAGFTCEAITEYRHIAAARRARNDLEGAARMYRKILSIDRGQEEVLQQLESLVSVKKRRSARRRRAVLTAIVTVLAGVAVYVVMLFEIRARGDKAEGEAEAKLLFAGHENAARRALARVESELALLREESDPDPVAYLERARRVHDACEKSIRTVLALYEEVIDRFPNSSSRRQAAEKIRDLEALREEVGHHENRARQKVQAKAVALFESACELSAAGLLVPALEKYRESLRLATDRRWTTRPEISIEKRIREHEEILEEAVEIKARARALIESGQIEEASQTLVRLLKTHAFIEIVRDVELPVLLTSTPDGATVIIPGREPLRTPVTILYPPRTGLRCRLEAPGFEPTVCEVAPLDLSMSLAELQQDLSARHHVQLEKGYQWSTDVGGSLQASPLVVGDIAYAGSRGGDLVCVRVVDGRILWTLDLPTLGGITTTPIAWGDLILVTVSNPNAILAVDPAERRVVWTFDGGGTLGAVSYQPALHGQGLYLSDDGGYVIRVELDRQRPWMKWRVRPGGEIRARLVPAGEVILVPSLAGSVFEIEVNRGRVRDTTRIGRPVTAPPLLVGDRILVASSDGKLRAVARGTGTVGWTVGTGGEIRSAPIVVGTRVIFGALDGVLRVVDLTDGAAIASIRTGGPLAASPIEVDGLVFATSHDGRVYALRLTETGIEQVWSYRTEARITASPLWVDGRVLIASEDGHLYALTP